MDTSHMTLRQNTDPDKTDDAPDQHLLNTTRRTRILVAANEYLEPSAWTSHQPRGPPCRRTDLKEDQLWRMRA